SSATQPQSQPGGSGAPPSGSGGNPAGPVQSTTASQSASTGLKYPAPPNFTAASDQGTGGSKAREWLHTVDLYFKHAGAISDKDKINFTLYLCRDGGWPWASELITLFTDTTLARTPYQSSILTIWGEWKASFLNQFSAANIRQFSTIHLKKLRQQPSQSITKFAGKFRELANCDDLDTHPVISRRGQG